jgi:RNA polymerase sigma factor (TIGR02999 family)
MPESLHTTTDEGIPASELFPQVYQELHKFAAIKMAGESPTQTLQPTALVNEAFLRLSRSNQLVWKNRAQFLAAASEAMRRILIDRARRKLAQKRGARAEKVDLSRIDVAIQTDDETLLRINEALEKLESLNRECAELIKMRYFVGLNYEEASQALGISIRTAKRHWTFGRTWLFRELNGS